MELTLSNALGKKQLYQCLMRGILSSNKTLEKSGIEMAYIRREPTIVSLLATNVPLLDQNLSIFTTDHFLSTIAVANVELAIDGQ